MTSSNSSNKPLLFDNIAISGRLGFGKSSLFQRLKPHLEPIGFTFFSSGKIVRDKTHEYVNPRADLLPNSFHQSLEEKVRVILEHEKKYVIESWLAGFIARDLPKTLKVLVYMSDEKVRVKRVAQRENISENKAAQLIAERESSNIELWQGMYGVHDFWDPSYFQVKLDTTLLDYDACVSQVLDALGISTDIQA